MSRWFRRSAVLGALACVVGCGGTGDDDRRPTPTQGPPTPTPLPVCRGVDPGSGLGCRAFTWDQPVATEDSGTQVIGTIQGLGGTTLPTLDFLDPGGVFPPENPSDSNIAPIPPGLALVADPPDADGIANVRIAGPQPVEAPGFVIIGLKPIQDYICLKLDLSTVQGKLYCEGSPTVGVGTSVTGPGGNVPPTTEEREFDLGDSARPGDMIIRVVQQQGRIMDGDDTRFEACFELPECGPGEDRGCYEPRFEIAFTTGTALVTKGDTSLTVLGEAGITGVPFDCNDWTNLEGPGRLVQGLADFDLVGLDVATGVALAE